MNPAKKPETNSEKGSRSRYIIALAIISGLAFVVAAQSGENKIAQKQQSFRVASDVTNQNGSAPRRHFRLRNPAELSNDEAEDIYGKFRGRLAKGYALSGIQAARDYQKWQRYNIAPFKSAAHGRRYVNHYANAKAQAYGGYEKVGVLPVGSIVAKDNLTVTGTSKVLPGALLLMEKMPAGFNYVSGDWRYTMIMPDGSIFGTTNGVGSNKVKFCIGCHLAVEKQDHLYFPPKQFRR